MLIKSIKICSAKKGKRKHYSFSVYICIFPDQSLDGLQDGCGPVELQNPWCGPAGQRPADDEQQEEGQLCQLEHDGRHDHEEESDCVIFYFSVFFCPSPALVTNILPDVQHF